MKWNKLLEKQAAGNAGEITLQLIKKLGVKVTKTTAIDTIERHPAYPSLLCISDSLHKWKIDNMGIAVEPDKLDSLPVPFIAHTTKSGGWFRLVEEVSIASVTYLDDDGRKQTAARETFVADWTGNALLAEAGAGSGEKNYTTNRRKEKLERFRIPFMLAVALACIILFAIFTINTLSVAVIGPTVLLTIKLAGITVSALLLWVELDKRNPALQQFCTGSAKTNCSAVLTSKGSKFLGWLSWSEVGFFYFTGSFLFLLTSFNNLLSAVVLLAWLNLIALPYTVFSVYYQWKVVKQWCPLCLTVQGLLLTEGIISYLAYWQHYSTYQSFNLSTLIPFLVSFSLPILFWIFTKPLLKLSQKAEQYRKEAAGLKYNPQLFEPLLQAQKAVTVSAEGLGIVIGNPVARHTIIKVCNPYCGPCAKAHSDIEELLHNNEDIKVQIIFTATGEDEDRKTPPAKHLMALAAKGDAALTEQALNDWYGVDKKDYESFASKYPLNGMLAKQSDKLEDMDSWCRAMDITFTPTIFVNGRQLPKVYSIKDLQYFLLA